MATEILTPKVVVSSIKSLDEHHGIMRSFVNKTKPEGHHVTYRMAMKLKMNVFVSKFEQQIWCGIFSDHA